MSLGWKQILSVWWSVFWRGALYGAVGGLSLVPVLAPSPGPQVILMPPHSMARWPGISRAFRHRCWRGSKH
jgi:hypothetical protein